MNRAIDQVVEPIRLSNCGPARNYICVQGGCYLRLPSGGIHARRSASESDLFAREPAFLCRYIDVCDVPAGPFSLSAMRASSGSDPAFILRIT